MRFSSSEHRFDVILFIGLAIACEVEVVVHELGRDQRSYPLMVAGVAAAAVMTGPLWWRRRSPLASTCGVMAGLIALLVVVRNDASIVNVPQLLLFVTPYSVAAYSSGALAEAGLAVCLAAAVAINLISPAGGGSWAFSLGACAAAWIVGRYVHTQRTLAADLQRTSDQIAIETESRERLAVAEQRTRIARELQTLVADNVSTMTVHAQAAQRLLESDPGLADEAMARIEDTGRSALSEMRLILGVLRRADQPADLAPQPGIGQIPALVDSARTPSRQIALRVDGEPGPLPASVDLGLYRILQDALGVRDDCDLDVALGFTDDHIDLRVTSKIPSTRWPTVAMRERVALCEGKLTVDTGTTDQTLVVRLPTELRGALA